MSPPDLSEALSSSESTVYRWLSGATTPHRPTRKKLADLLRVQLAWLESGEGPIELATPKGETRASSADQDLTTVPNQDLVPIRDHATVEAGANPIGAELDDESVTGLVWFPRQLVREMFGVDDPARVRRITVTGDSMWPSLQSGQKVYAVLLTGDDRPISSAIYLIDGPHGFLVKRVVFTSSDAEAEAGPSYRVVLRSDNEDKGRYPDEAFPLEVFQRDFRLVAHVVRAEQAL